MGRLFVDGGTHVNFPMLPRDKPRLALILGTGWQDKEELMRHGFVPECIVELRRVGLTAPISGDAAGHNMDLLFGTWHEIPVVISAGRFHLYQEQHGYSSIIRRWMSLLINLMGEHPRIIITSAVGGLVRDFSWSGITPDNIERGMITCPTGIVSAHLPQPYLNAHASEFVLSEHLLVSNEERFKIFKAAAEDANLKYVFGTTHQMIPGPGFGGGTERRLWGRQGCQTVGMSLDPELRLIAVENQDRITRHLTPKPLPQIEVFPVHYVTDDHDLPNHEDITREAKARAPQLGHFLSELVRTWGNPNS